MMDSIENDFTLPITLFPTEILRIILKNVDWRSIINLRLISTFFNNFIMQNLNYLPKPKIREFKIKSLYVNNDKIEVSLLFNCEYYLYDVMDVCISIDDKNIPQIEDYFKRMDFSRINFIEIDITGKSMIFDILSRYLTNHTVIGTIIIDIKRSPIFDSFSNFIKNLKNISCLHLKKVCFSHQIIPHNYLLPMINTMEYLFIEECYCTTFINPLMMNKLFLNNTSLKNIAIFSKCKTFQDDLFKNIKDRHKLSKYQKDKNIDYVIYLLSQNEDGNINEYLENLFPSTNFYVNKWFTSINFHSCFSTKQCTVNEIQLNSLS
uniref:F-box domain-containing protein n=1 Tax=Strongyloides venezuelensis TaxID=75913 RepID=A0A0K0F579_STRVS